MGVKAKNIACRKGETTFFADSFWNEPMGMQNLLKKHYDHTTVYRSRQTRLKENRIFMNVGIFNLISSRD